MSEIRTVGLSGGPLNGQTATVAEGVTQIEQEDPATGEMGTYTEQSDPTLPWVWASAGS